MKKNKNLRANSGKMCSGKTTLANFFRTEENFHIISIGSTIKQISNYLILEHDDEFRKLLLSITGSKAKQNRVLSNILTQHSNVSLSDFSLDPQGHFIKNNAYRKITQLVGRAVRDECGNDAWINYVMNRAIHLIAEGERVVCDDLREVSEADLFREHHAYVFRLDVSPEEQRKRVFEMYGDVSETQLLHSNERALDEYPYFDFVINNTSLSPNETYQHVTDFLTSQ